MLVSGARIRSPRRSTRWPRTSGCCWRWTSSRSCSRPALDERSAPHSSTCSLARQPIRMAARSSWWPCAPTSTGASPPTRALAELLGANHVLVGPMQASELRRAVELPAGRVGLRVEPELTDALVDDVEGEPGALPLLSTALLELWQKRQDNTLTLAVVSRVRGRARRRRPAGRGHLRARPRRAQAARARASCCAWSARARATRPCAAARRSPSSTSSATRTGRRARARWPTAGSSPCPRAASRSRTRRCCASGRGCASGSRRTAQGRRLRRHITQAATEWDAAGRDPGELYRGARLAAALDWSADHALELNELEREFVTESREASEQETKRVRRTNRRLRGLLAGVAVLLAAAVAGGIFAVIQRGEARSRARRATPRPPSSPSASAPRRSSRRTSTSRCCSPARRWRSTTRPRPAATCSPTLLRAPAAIGIMHGSRATPDCRTRASARTGGRSRWLELRQAPLLRHARRTS